ncbi:unnamed protein product [Chironomus riparius]|uniref:Uncharacterized protein n=1 Tax=Chironomus riparius TaxID=315576 RepID=A0A9N9RJH0_9DIPT|nr:unnamed protein product [Chironomus riparius]
MTSVEGSRNLVLLIIFNILILTHSLAIDPKLDFGDNRGLVEVKKDIKTGKIKGLRVTVDTSELKESKSSGSDSSSSSDSSETKKVVGVRTDVTFEITSGETNDTKTVDEKEIGKEDDNASIPVVPVFKGTPDRGGISSGHVKESIDNEILSVIPLENPSQPLPPRGPIFHRQDDRNQFNGGGHSDESWKQIPQYAIWTTERYNNRRFHQEPVFHHRNDQFDILRKPSNFIPYQIHHDRHLPWEPCTCKEYPGPLLNPQHPSSSSHEFKLTNKVDDKLERPFSKTT